MTWKKWIYSLGAVACFACLPLSIAAADEEWEERNNPYYEDDAWYDISEWFDGNDYNPTDEVFFRWDDEKYERAEDTGSDVDSDHFLSGPNYYDYDRDYDYDYDSQYEPWTSDYGYDDRSENDNWFYDYYDDGYATYLDDDDNNVFEHQFRYYDYDNDGLYDAYSSYSDWDSDGFFEDFDYYSFNDVANTSDNEQKAKSQAEKDAKRRSVSGEIVKLKKVAVGDTKNRIVQLEKNNGQKCLVDLGPVSKLDDFDLSEGDQITVRGAVTKVGEKKVMLAEHLKSNGESAKIDRDRRTFTGQVANTRVMDVRGRKHQMLILKNGGEKRRLVDLGPAGNFEVDLNQGDTVTVTGPTVKVADRRLMMAQSLKRDGKQIEIDRSAKKASESSSGQQQRGNREAMRQRKVSGEVVETRTVDVRGTDRLIVELETDSGDRITADLGAKSRLDQLSIDEGSFVTVRGVPLKADDQRLIVASQVTSDDQTKQVRNLRGNQKEGSSQRIRSLSGEVLSTRQVTVRGTKRLMAKVELDSGDPIMVDLGPARQMKDLSVEKGNQLTARGIPLKIDGQRIFVATRVELGDQSKEIRRAVRKEQRSANREDVKARRN